MAVIDRREIAGRARPAQAQAVDARQLARALARELRGEVRFSQGSRALYANDASVYRQMPIGVVIPRDAADVVAAVEICRSHEAPVGARGCGTGLAGQTVNEAVMFDFSKYMNEIVELDPSGGARACSPVSYSTGCAMPPRSTSSPSGRIRPRTAAARWAG
jgi:FAD binding domain